VVRDEFLERDETETRQGQKKHIEFND